MQSLTLNDLINRTMTGEERFYLASDVDPYIARLKWEHESIEQMQRERQQKLDARIAGLEKALRDIRVFLVEVNKGIEMGNIDSQIVADIDRALMVK